MNEVKQPYTIRIFVQDGDPEGIRIVDKMNWTGTCVTFPREKWKDVRTQNELKKPGIYVLTGHDEESELPSVYIGQAEEVAKRLENHEKNKDFWDRAVVFVSSSNALNKAHITWIECKLIELARAYKQCVLLNGTEPQELNLSRAEKADTEAFLQEMLSIYPILGVKAFEQPKVVAVVSKDSSMTATITSPRAINTLVVPAKEEGFKRVFLGEHCWYAVRIAAGKIDQIKYIAAYQSAPVSAITHYAPVQSIESYGDSGKYKLIFSEPAKELAHPIEIADAPSGIMQGPRYANFDRLFTVKTVRELLD
jgi:hypothetical protein